MKTDFYEFAKAMTQFLPDDAKIMYCQFRGDPNADQRGKWRARVLENLNLVDEWANVYVCVSAMKRNDRGEWRRRKDNFAGGLLLMIDDLGDGPGSKFPLSIIDPLPPTALIETSPNNMQAVYMFNCLVEDELLMDALIRSFIARQFLDNDTGMAGVNRVFRPPIGVNAKPKYNGWKVKLAQWNPENRYSIDQIAQAFDLDLVKARGRPKDPSIIAGAKPDRIRAFVGVRQALGAAGMLKKDNVDMSGWQDVICPWTDNHTGAADTGAAICEPSLDNDWYGGFRCHHGGCKDKSWRVLTEWVAQEAAENLEEINSLAPKTYSFLEKDND